jgi:GNAT superfamily N-acetyltransferase
VSRPEIVPFSDEHLDGAAARLAERHARHRAVEPTLPRDVDFREQIQRERDETGGAVAVTGDEVVGYLLGKRREDPIGAHVWSHVAGHAVREPELVRDLYRAAAERWVEAGLTRHFVFVPALPELVDPWFRLSFGASSALAVRETTPEPPMDVSVTIRESNPDDARAAVLLERHMVESMIPSPSFSHYVPDDEETATEEWAETWVETDTYRHFVAERGGRIVGHVLLYRRPHDLRVPTDSIDLAAASTEPGQRGTGVGVALTNHVLTWAYEHGCPTMITDWRMTNLLASRFWPRRGFRETFLRLYRSIP